MQLACQRYEYFLSLLYIAFLELDVVKKPEASIYEILDRKSKLTVGNFLKPVRSFLKGVPEFKVELALLERALIARNYFVHDYWIEKRKDFENPERHPKIVRELALMTSHVEMATDYVTKTLNHNLKELYDAEISDYEEHINSHRKQKQKHGN